MTPSPRAPPPAPGPRRPQRAVASGVVGGVAVYLVLNPALANRIMQDAWDHAAIVTAAAVLGILWLVDAPARLRGR